MKPKKPSIWALEIMLLVKALCRAALVFWVVAAVASEPLQISPRPNSEAGGLNISHPDLPGNTFDFRTCETVLDGNRDFGLFRVKLALPGAQGKPAWNTNDGSFRYEWTYPEGIVVRFQATALAGRVALVYTMVNRTAAPLEQVHLHTCVTTTEAPLFFPRLTTRLESQLPVDTQYQDYTELFSRLFVWKRGQAFPFDTTEHRRREVHLSLMPDGLAPIQWAWWVNSTNTFDEPLIALAGRDSQWTAALWFERAAWASANAGDSRACFHLFPLLGRIEPGHSATVRGAFYLLRGSPAELRRKVRAEAGDLSAGGGITPDEPGVVSKVSARPDPSTYVLHNSRLSLGLDEKTGAMIRLENKLTGEVYPITGDEFAVKTAQWDVGFSDVKLASLSRQPGRIVARYEHPKLDIEIAFSLGQEQAFIQKKLQMTFKEACGLKEVVVSKPTFSAEGLQTVCYRYPDFEIVRAMVKSWHGWDFTRPTNSEPTRTFFGRTAKGGFFTGIEMPYDESVANENSVTLCYAPSLKIVAGQKLEGEPMYLGVYRRSEQDGREDNSWQAVESLWLTPKEEGFDGTMLTSTGGKGAAAKKEISVPKPDIMPLPSEHQAISAMVTSVLGPVRHGLKAYACGWHCQMQLDGYDSEEELQADLKALEFFKECGVDGFSESAPWGGETKQMNALREGDHFQIGDRNRRLLERAKELRLEVFQWPTMNNTHPWNKLGGPFRLDKPEWLRGVAGKPSLKPHVGGFTQQFANCIACEPFSNWLEKLILDTLATGYYQSWGMDGDFWGTAAYFHTTIPVTCQADYHDHLAGDANYACQRALARLFAKVRQEHPELYILMCRPAMDLGVWALRDVDSCFTLIETGTGASNITGGNEIRTASRIRLQHQFIPPWLDSALLFPSYANPNRKSFPRWPSENLDYILLSALSSTPNPLMYLPGRTGIPDADKAQIRKWLDWGRKNREYLFARHDLFDWPQKGKVDGSAHLLGDHGFIFLFNSDKAEQTVEFALTPESTGFTGSAPVEISQEYPASDHRKTQQPGTSVRWPVPAESALILRINVLP